ncbi:MAG: hypothetical protein ABI536_00940, partial [Gallionella sp.]
EKGRGQEEASSKKSRSQEEASSEKGRGQEEASSTYGLQAHDACTFGACTCTSGRNMAFSYTGNRQAELVGSIAVVVAAPDASFVQ